MKVGLLMHFKDNKRNKLKQKMDNGQLIICVGTDSLQEIQLCQQLNCDMILVYPTAKYSNATNRFLAGYLAFDNTNDLMLESSKEMFSILDNTNLLISVNCSDPFMVPNIILKQFKELHVAGIHNYPSMSLVDGNFGANINSRKLGFDMEINMLKTYSDQNFYTCAMVRNTKQAILMTRANVDMLIFYLGLGHNKSSKRYNKTTKLEDDITLLKEMSAAVRTISSEIPLLFFSEHVNTIDDIKKIIKNVPNINGYCLMPVAQSSISARQLELEILQLQKITY
ncbi:MAG: phosphoenolpyruvate hydrolase family protein [Lachnospiraceae bacterium]|nr:phosphoenolpyruvate hydrolase family protein [Lachnospiraceae bacterium]